VVAGLTACVGLFVPYADARYILHEITTRGLAFVILSAIFGLGSLWLLETIDARHPSGSGVCGGRARAGLGPRAVGLRLPQTLTVAEAAAPTGTIAAVLIATGLA
jgi:cytochrome d ubiquinol oxidase subunit II